MKLTIILRKMKRKKKIQGQTLSCQSVKYSNMIGPEKRYIAEMILPTTMQMHSADNLSNGKVLNVISIMNRHIRMSLGKLSALCFTILLGSEDSST